MADIKAALPPPPPQKAPLQAQPPRWASAAATLRGVADVLVRGVADVPRRRRICVAVTAAEEHAALRTEALLDASSFSSWRLLDVLQPSFAPEKGSCQERVGSILADIGVFAGSAMGCFVVAPNLLIFLTRAYKLGSLNCLNLGDNPGDVSCAPSKIPSTA
uniref:Uncharacterized protein n=1 Tax=Oryza punctata TaxID=4537 RepID=A0A0E0LUX0_ORYPU